MVREISTASFANLASGRPFALTGGTVILEDGSQVVSDIIVGADGRIVAVEPFLDTASCGACVDIAGMLVSPGFLDAHQHLDKTGVLRFTPNPSGTLQGAREAFAKYARTAGPDDIHKRATRTVERCLSRGTTAIRSHINVDKDAGRIKAKVLFLPAKTDLIFPPELSRRAAEKLKAQGNHVELYEIDGTSGHLDGLFSIGKVAEQIRAFLQK